MRIKTAILATFLIAAASGCTTPYTNKELQNIFNAKGLETVEREQGLVVFLPGVFFEFNKADLSQPARMKVSEIASIANDPHVVERKLLIEGHTDSSGSYEYNLELSNRRAETVHQALLAGKVADSRMSTRGYGEKYPIADNLKADGSPNPVGQAKNRRVEVVVKNPENDQ